MVKGIPKDININSIEANPLLLIYSNTASIVSKDSVYSKIASKEHHIPIKKSVVTVSVKDMHVIEKIISTDTLASIKLTIPPGYEQPYVYPDNSNFITAIPNKKLEASFNYKLISKEKIKKDSTLIKVSPKIIVKPVITGKVGTLRQESSISWLPVILLLSLFTFSWLKIMYQKYILQVVLSIVNYQVALRLLRERNVLFRNMSIGLNFVFILNLAVFIYFLFENFKIRPYFTIPILNYLVYCVGVIVFFNLKNFVCILLGIIFKYQEEFSEYIHNENLFNKNIGLLLFPIVVLFPYVPDIYKQFVLFAGIFFFGIMILLRTLRGFQIIIRKGVSKFYMILYLCAIEILPVLILIKYSMTLI